MGESPRTVGVYVFGSTILEVAVGLIFVYLVLSLLCTSVNETIAQALSLRAETLYEAVHGLFAGPDAHRLAEDIYDHDIVKSLSKNGAVVQQNGVSVQTYKKPSYLAAQSFSSTLISLLQLHDPQSHPNAGSVVDQILANKNYEKETLQLLVPLLAPVKNDLVAAQQKLEEWYDGVMERASGWYKKRLHALSFAVALAVAVVANADTLMIFDRLWASPVQRTAIQASAGALSSGKQPASYKDLSDATKQAALGMLGWAKNSDPADPRHLPTDLGGWFRKLIGIIITAFAACLGAPFWFDMLNKVMNIRASGASPKEAPKTKPRGGGGTPSPQDSGSP